MADFLPPEFWSSGLTQPSIPFNDHFLRWWISQTDVDNATTAQPVSPSDGDTYIIQSTHTGTQWSTFSPKDLAIFYGGTWYNYTPSEGVTVSVSGVRYIYTGGVWTAATGGSAGDIVAPLSSPEISVTGATTATISRFHVASGTTADYALTLPAASGNAGKLIGIRISSGCTRWITVTGNGAEMIDGSNTRRMWAQESAILMCDGTGWTKIGGKSRALAAIVKRTTGVLSVVPAGWYPIPVNSVVSDNTSALATPQFDSVNGRVRVLRSSNYTVSGFAGWTGVTTGKLQAVAVVRWNSGSGTPNNPADEPNSWAGVAASTAGDCYINCGGSYFTAAVGDAFTLSCFNNDTVNRNIASAASLLPTISVLETPSW